jgi:rare lipoprotein A (peptidoglycan hydrolase)
MRSPKGTIRAVFAVLSTTALLGSAGVASAQVGGVSSPTSEGGTTTDSTYSYSGFGSRDLSMGMSGEDVKTLNWLMNSIAGDGPFDGYFSSPTDWLVRDFQADAGLSSDGVVAKSTRKKLASRMRNNLATWYGPGFWGNRTACGRKLKPTTIGVAHKKLPCGTRVTFAYMGRWVRAKVIDRGPYNGDYKWDLTKKAAKRLGFLATGAGRLKAAVVYD